MVCNENNLSDGADVIKDNVEVHAKKETKKRNFDNIAEKVTYDSSVHNLIPKEKFPSKTRYKKRDKRTDKKKKGVKKEQHYSEQYHDLMLDNLLKQYYSMKSPHLIISGKWFYKIRKNTIMLNSV